MTDTTHHCRERLCVSETSTRLQNPHLDLGKRLRYTLDECIPLEEYNGWHCQHSDHAFQATPPLTENHLRVVIDGVQASFPYMMVVGGQELPVPVERHIGYSMLVRRFISYYEMFVSAPKDALDSYL